MDKGLILAGALTKDNSVYMAEAKNDGQTARVGVAFDWSPVLLGDLADQYVGMPAPAAPGVAPDDVVWDEYVSQLEALGVQNNVEIWQAAYGNRAK
ncbi:hypothetical protein [Dermabacter hominis]|uniref:hypothetical protein n=1 Tax=Dermabacter hominis TaxID=36740 RepID=UPI00223AD3BC|nr:hypothetical protein [Dermabacter hominis]MCT2025242.1 hypothetical protein [Dermabacter hominis]